VIDEQEALEELKYKQAMELRGDYSYSFARDSRYRRAVMPMEIDDFLREKSKAGIIFYGMVDIYNTQFIFVCSRFDYIVDRYVVEGEFVQTTIECKINYDSISTHQYAIKIQEFVEASYNNYEWLMLEDIIHKLYDFAGDH